MKNGLKYGLMAGIVMALIFIIVNFINPALNFYISFSLIVSSVVYLIFMIIAGMKERYFLGGELKFGEAFIVSMIVYAISSLIFSITTVLAVKFSPELLEVALEVSRESAESTMRMMGASEDQIIEAMEGQQGVNSEMSNPYEFSVAMISWLISLVFPGLLYAIISAAISKKSAPANAPLDA